MLIKGTREQLRKILKESFKTRQFGDKRQKGDCRIFMKIDLKNTKRIKKILVRIKMKKIPREYPKN